MKRFVLIFIMCTFIFLLNGLGQAQTNQEGLSYEVDVDAQLIPIFAVDKDGNPVYDLNPEEFELYIDGKLTEIISFTYYQIETSEKIEEQAGVQTPRSPERLIFIIIDSIASNRTVMPLAVEVVERLINSASPGDGFRYVIGPEKDKGKLTEALKEMENSFFGRETKVDDTAVRQMKGYRGQGQFNNSGVLTMREFTNAMEKAEIERKSYQNDIRIFSESIQQLKSIGNRTQCYKYERLQATDQSRRSHQPGWKHALCHQPDGGRNSPGKKCV